METKTIRLANFLELARKYPLIIDFCQRIEMAPSYFSQIKSKKKAIGDDVARKVEAALGLNRGWLDVPQGRHEEKRLPESDVLAVSYAIEALPPALREQIKKLVFQISAYCSAEPQDKDIMQHGEFDVELFRIRSKNEQNGDHQIPETRITTE